MTLHSIVSFAIVLSVWLLTGISAPEIQQAQVAPTGQFSPKPFKDDVHIDWLRNRVEIDAKVVLRRGPLELLVCSPGTREHESIFVSSAKPSAIYQAMGLIGLSPGHPVSYNPKTEQLIPPAGESLKLSVRWQNGLKLTTVPVERWLQLQDEKKSPTEIDWMFTGSVRTTDGRFAADLEGTVVSVVDFASALIAVGALHSDSNELLWVQAFESRIPAVQTTCTIIIESAERVTIGLVLQKRGELVHDGIATTAQGLAKLVKQQVRDHYKVVINLGINEGVSEKIVEKTLASLVAAGLDRSMVSLRKRSQ
ncbi:hypothetical protein JYU10_00420 [bacterium AH-315-J04]|nr:hypothetical protein [bacterium AH-315-J04]